MKKENAFFDNVSSPIAWNTEKFDSKFARFVKEGEKEFLEVMDDLMDEQVSFFAINRGALRPRTEMADISLRRRLEAGLRGPPG
jgi:hypothetical protein